MIFSILYVCKMLDVFDTSLVFTFAHGIDASTYLSYSIDYYLRYLTYHRWV